jgi:hypothetical protein
MPAPMHEEVGLTHPSTVYAVRFCRGAVAISLDPLMLDDLVKFSAVSSGKYGVTLELEGLPPTVSCKLFDAALNA